MKPYSLHRAVPPESRRQNVFSQHSAVLAQVSRNSLQAWVKCRGEGQQEGRR
jgi:hypothetical protein